MYRCSFCDREFSKKGSLVGHEFWCSKNPDLERNQQSVQNPGSCSYCGKLCLNPNSLHNHERRCSKNPDKLPVSEEFLRYSHSSWNKGLTAQTDSRVAKGVETLRRLALEGKINYATGERNGSSKESVKQQISETCRQRVRDGSWHTSLAKDMHYCYKGVDLHGSWELKYAQYLDGLGIPWERVKMSFPYDWNGAVHHYTPDFYLPDTQEYIEIKGYRTSKDLCKWEQFPKHLKLVVYTKADLIKLGVL